MHHLTETQQIDLLYGELSPTDAHAAKEHLAACDVCRSEYEEMLQTRQWLDGIAVPGPEDLPVSDACAMVCLVNEEEVGRRRTRRRRLRLAVAASILIAVAALSGVRVEWRPMSISSTDNHVESQGHLELKGEIESLRRTLQDQEDQLAEFRVVVQLLDEQRRQETVFTQRQLLALEQRLDLAKQRSNQRWETVGAGLRNLYAWQRTSNQFVEMSSIGEQR